MQDPQLASALPHLRSFTCCASSLGKRGSGKQHSPVSILCSSRPSPSAALRFKERNRSF